MLPWKPVCVCVCVCVCVAAVEWHRRHDRRDDDPGKEVNVGVAGEILAVAQAFDRDGGLIVEDLTTVQIGHDWKITGRTVLCVPRDREDNPYVAEVRLLDLAGNVRSSRYGCGQAYAGGNVEIDWNMTLIPKRARDEL